MPEASERWRATALIAAPRLSFSPMLVRRFITDRRTSATTLVTRSRSIANCFGLLLVGGTGREGVDQVAERGDVLGHAVVHLAGQPLPLVGGRDVAEVGEQQSGVELDHAGGASAIVSSSNGSSTPLRGSVAVAVAGQPRPATIAVSPAPNANPDPRSPARPGPTRRSRASRRHRRSAGVELGAGGDRGQCVAARHVERQARLGTRSPTTASISPPRAATSRPELRSPDSSISCWIRCCASR